MQTYILFKLALSHSITLALLIPLLSVTMTVFLYIGAQRNESCRFGRVARFLTCPIQLMPLRFDGFPPYQDMKMHLRRQLINRYLLFLLLLILFFVGNVIATFYHVLSDYAINVIDPEFVSSTWIQIIIESPFNGGWYGTLPWYGDRFLPPEGAIVYHETWSWIYFSAGITDDCSFFIGATNIVLIVSILFGGVFLIPLVSRSIRKSFSQSLFFLITGMLVLTRGIFGCFSQAVQLEYGSSILRYGIRLVFPGQLGVTTEAAIIHTLLPLIVFLSIAFMFVGGKLWKTHYPNHGKLHLLFVLYIALTYWISLILVMTT